MVEDAAQPNRSRGGLPRLVERYLERALPAGALSISKVRVGQVGEMWQKTGRPPNALPGAGVSVEKVAFTWRARFPIFGPLAIMVVDRYGDNEGLLEAPVRRPGHCANMGRRRRRGRRPGTWPRFAKCLSVQRRPKGRSMAPLQARLKLAPLSGSEATRVAPRGAPLSGGRHYARRERARRHRRGWRFHGRDPSLVVGVPAIVQETLRVWVVVPALTIGG
jgi:hypothetical protein